MSPIFFLYGSVLSVTCELQYDACNDEPVTGALALPDTGQLALLHHDGSAATVTLLSSRHFRSMPVEPFLETGDDGTSLPPTSNPRCDQKLLECEEDMEDIIRRIRM